jgi:uncharacterized membrane protein
MPFYTKQPFKLSIGIALCLIFRALPFRPANIEPLLATQMPYAKLYGPWSGFIFGSVSILLFDFVTQKIGIWTIITMFAYGFLGVGASYFFKKYAQSTRNYIRFAIIATILYDAFTGLTIGPLFFHQTFMQALIGQIPFTILHLIGNVAFAVTLSPAIYHLLVRKREPSPASLLTLNYIKS